MQSNIVKVTYKQALKQMMPAVFAKKVVMFHGDPGIGKSAIGGHLRDTYNWTMRDIRLAQWDPTELNGFPVFIEDPDTGEKRAVYVPMSVFPLTSTPLPKGKNGWLLFFDEINTAARAVQAACYKIILDRMIGEHKLHPNVVIVCAGNLESNNAIVNKMSTALQSRMVHFILKTDAPGWLAWAARANIDFHVTSYIESHVDMLHKFDPEHNDLTFPCPRTWEFISDEIKHIPPNDQGEVDLTEYKALFAGTVGIAAATSFLTHVKIHLKLPQYKDIMRDPTGAEVPSEPAYRFALAHQLAAYAKPADLPVLIKYLKRMPMELQTVTLQNMIGRDHDIIDTAEVQDWLVNHSTNLIL